MTDALIFRSARDLIDGLRRRDFSARELLAEHLAQIERINPAINAVVSMDIEGAELAAAEADRRCAAGEPLGPLHGLPISYKDTHATAGMTTTYGSSLHATNVPDRDDEIVHRIQAAGAIRIGKTNVPEFAAGSHSFNSVFGTTRNPWAVARSAGGSSGGAAAALAAGLQPIADGTDMGGSLRNPASFCNVVGLRPTPGRVPEPGAAIGFSPLGVGGPMARSVDDLALLLSVIAGPHPDDPLSLSDDPAALQHVTTADLRRMRVAWAPTLGDRVRVEQQVLTVLEPAVQLFESLGADVEPACPDLTGADETFRTLRASQFDLLWGDLLAAHPDAFKPDLAWNIRQGQGRGESPLSSRSMWLCSGAINPGTRVRSPASIAARSASSAACSAQRDAPCSVTISSNSLSSSRRAIGGAGGRASRCVHALALMVGVGSMLAFAVRSMMRPYQAGEGVMRSGPVEGYAGRGWSLLRTWRPRPATPFRCAPE